MSYLTSKLSSGQKKNSPSMQHTSTKQNAWWPSDNSESFAESFDGGVFQWREAPHRDTVEETTGNQNLSHAKLHRSMSPRMSSMYSSTGEPLPLSLPTDPPARTPPRPPLQEKPIPSDYKEAKQAEYKTVFKPLEEYLTTCFKCHATINASFSTCRPTPLPRAASEGAGGCRPVIGVDRRLKTEDIISAMDGKTLLLGDFAENGAWWTGNREIPKVPDRSRSYNVNGLHEATPADGVSNRSPRIEWGELEEWYDLVLHAGRDWERIWSENSVRSTAEFARPTQDELDDVRHTILEAERYVRRVLLKATENLLKRPGGMLNEPGDLRFLIIILANPELYPSYSTRSHARQNSGLDASLEIRMPLRERQPAHRTKSNEKPPKKDAISVEDSGPGRHSGIIKRILGLLSHLSNECHHHLVAWFARLAEPRFRRITELVGSFVTYRLTRQHGKRQKIDHDMTGGLIPTMSSSGRGTSAALHAALGGRGQNTKTSDGKPKPVIYNDDWQIKAAARVMALLFAANNSQHTRQVEHRRTAESHYSVVLPERERARRRGQILTTSDFYNTLLDYSDLIADFEAWESKRGKFAFCQYPFFLSIWAKIQIMEHDARRQMEVKAREAFFDSIMTHKSVNQYLILRVRRECLVEDSLKGVSEVVGSGGEEIKKGLRIEFKGEEGIDAGGLRKEWFLLLVRDVFNPEHGMLRHICLQ